MVTVIGLGFVGLTTALGFAEYGSKVYGIEISKDRMAAIRKGELPFLEPGLDDALQRHLGKNFIPTDDLEAAVADSEYIFYCVGTPYTGSGEADLTYLFDALEQTLAAVHDDHFRVLVTKSTIPPSTAQEKIIPFLENKGIKIPEQMSVANNPEFLREGHCWDDFINADRIVLGVTDKRSEMMLKKLYEPSGVPVFAVSLNTAEFIKYLSNASLACLISFANEMSITADKIGDIDVSEAFHILHMDKRWQTGSIRSYFYPGCGYGGYCLPKDTNALYAASKNAGSDARILKEIISLNDKMPEKTAERIINIVGPEKNTCIGILGLSFKAESDDVRDTPAAKIIKELIIKGYRNIIAFDPAAIKTFKSSNSELQIGYCESFEEILSKADVFAVTTAWPEFSDIREKTGKPVIDCRYMLK